MKPSPSQQDEQDKRANAAEQVRSDLNAARNVREAETRAAADGGNGAVEDDPAVETDY